MARPHSFRGFAAIVTLSSLAVACRTSYPQAAALTETLTANSSSPVSAEEWIAHYRHDLLPFWNHPDALGSPIGNFPTFRCNDGAKFDAAKPCPELSEAESWIRSETIAVGDHTEIADTLGRIYVRMASRQTFFYGVGFNMTGDPELLELAKAGVDFMRQHAIRSDGSVVTYWQDGQPDKLGQAATSQDAAYALMGLSFYYYLTRDAAVLSDILRIKGHIFATYFKADGFGPGSGLMQWNDLPSNPVILDLTAHLDQLNAYMVLLEPSLPEAVRTSWRGDMTQLVNSLRHKFYDSSSGLFRSQLQDPSTNLPGWAHMDFGHTVKTFWMLQLIAKQTRDPDLETFATKGIRSTIKAAYLGKDAAGRTLGFASRPHLWEGLPPHADPTPVNCPASIKKPLNCEQEWWIFDELDQAGATVALNDPEIGAIVDETNRYWLSQFVDQSGKEVWPMLTAPYGLPKYPKAHLWKSGFHSSEHALVGYLTAYWRAGQLAPLYFAWQQPEAVQYTPAYVFQAENVQVENVAGSDGPIQKVLFSSPR